MKDVATCEKPRQDGNNLRPGDLRIGQPNQGNAWLSPAESNRQVEANAGKWNISVPAGKENNVISWVAASETETA